MTVDAVVDRRKTVTRRDVDTWVDLVAGDRLTLIEKGMGLPKGARQVVLAEVEIVSNRIEDLSRVDQAECDAEGLGNMSPHEFRAFWASGHGYGKRLPIRVLAVVPCRRIEWRYL